MKPPTTIEAFLQEFDRALVLSGRHRRRVLDEARDHLIEAKERGIRAGLDPLAAEIAAIEAFGDPVAVASRFEKGFRERLWGAVDRYDRWRSVHPTAGTIVVFGPMALGMTLMWSPVMALSFLPPWAILVWIGSQLRQRREPGYRHRLWGWKQQHPAAYHISTNLAGLLGGATFFGLQLLSGMPHLTPWLFLFLAPFVPVGWILNTPRRHQPPATPAA